MIDQELYRLNEKYNILMNVDEEDKTKFKSILSWAEKTMELCVKERITRENTHKRGEIWTCMLGENIGSELNKTRPCLIFQNDTGNEKSPTTIVIPIKSQSKHLITHVELSPEDLIEGTDVVRGSCIIEQIRCVSRARLGEKIATLTNEAMKRVEYAFAIACSMKNSLPRTDTNPNVSVSA